MCAVVGDVLSTTGSHPTLNALFKSAGAPGDPPDLAHWAKWKTWLFICGQTDGVDSLEVLGNVLEEFMDIPPDDPSNLDSWRERRARVEAALADNGLRYFRFGRVLPQGVQPRPAHDGMELLNRDPPAKPGHVDELLEVIVDTCAEDGLNLAFWPADTACGQGHWLRPQACGDETIDGRAGAAGQQADRGKSKDLERHEDAGLRVEEAVIPRRPTSIQSRSRCIFWTHRRDATLPRSEGLGDHLTDGDSGGPRWRRHKPVAPIRASPRSN